jgi:hypothetical protein
LSKHKRSAFSLVAAFGVTRDRQYLREAATNAPNDPFVQTQVLLHNVFPEERQKWIDALEKSSPENSLANFFRSRELMAAGDVAGAVAEVDRARGKSLDDMAKEMAFAQEEAYLSAGRPPAEAKALGSAEVLLPHLAQFKRLGVDLADAATRYGAAGDTASQQEILAATWEIGRQLREDGRKGTLLNELVGLAVENNVLNKWPDGTDAPFLNRSIEEQKAQNREFRAEVHDVSPILERWLPTASESDVIHYLDRLRMFGEWETFKWLRNQHPELMQ